MKTLAVTSPYTTGPEVVVAQRRLNGLNYLNTDYLDGPVDGVFGELTGRACVRAKYWQGYPEKDLLPFYGDLLDRYLSGARALPATFKVRRAARMKAAQQIPLRAKALVEARKHVGVKESPAGSNKVRFSDWYGIRGPWCAMFVTWCYVQAGSKAFVRGRRYAYCPYIVHDARAGLNWLQAITASKAQAGDIVLYDWHSDGVSDHVGLLMGPVKAGRFQAVEGNTAIGDDSNGGEVMVRNRTVGQVLLFARCSK